MNKNLAMAVVFGAMANASLASVANYGLTFYEDRNQVSNSAPPVSIAFIQAAINSTNSGELLTGEVQSPTGHVDVLGLAGPTLLLGGGSQSYTSTAAMAAGAYPGGSYTFRILSGTAGPASAGLNVPGYDFATAIPYLTGTSFSSLQLAPAGVDRPITFNAFSNTSFATTKDNTIQVLGLTNVYHYVGAIGNSSLSTGTTIPGTWLVSGHSYGLYLDFSCASGTLSTGFGGATGGVSFHRRCYLEFKIKASPKTISGKLTLENIGYYSGEPITVEVLDSAGATIETHHLLADYRGLYAFNSAFGGTHRVRFKGRHWLSNVTAPLNFDTGQDAANLSLLNGDIDGDNSITVFDYGVLSDYFDLSYLDANWGVVGSNGFRPSDADIDNDGSVNVFDYGVVSTNFDQNGL